MRTVQPPVHRLLALGAAVLLLAGAGCGTGLRPAPPAPAPTLTSPQPAPETGTGRPDHPSPGEPGQSPAGGAETEAGPPEPAPAAEPSEPAPAAEPREPAHGPVASPGWYVPKPGSPLRPLDPALQGQKVVLLTFDDGPDPTYTPVVLDILRQHNVKALFFVTGRAARHPDLIRRMIAEGHQVGNHTMYHENLRQMSREQQYEAIAGLNRILAGITGEQPKFFRPPFGAYDGNTVAIVQELGMELINWSHGSCDWCDVRGGYKDPAEVVEDVLAEKPVRPNRTHLHPGAVILMHDTLRHTAEALPAILDGLAAKGYTFTLLSERPQEKEGSG